MRLHYRGTYSGNEDDLPNAGHEDGAVRFEEPEDSGELAKKANLIAVFVYVPALLIFFWRSIAFGFQPTGYFIGFVLSFLTLFPHEFLHALCFREDVYLYTNLKQGMLFVVGPERMTKAHFIFMSLLPNLVFGLLPFLAFLIDPHLPVLGAMGVMALGMGSGDYLNIYNALRQVPSGAKIYSYGFHSYWYRPKAD